MNIVNNYIYDNYSADCIVLRPFKRNTNAIKCYQKVWFKEYGRRKDMHYCNWKFRDEIYMDITKEDREKKNEKLLHGK